jgi:hypothetical protein
VESQERELKKASGDAARARHEVMTLKEQLNVLGQSLEQMKSFVDKDVKLLVKKGGAGAGVAAGSGGSPAKGHHAAAAGAAASGGSKPSWSLKPPWMRRSGSGRESRADTLSYSSIGSRSETGSQADLATGQASRPISPG